jgi:hypothetical protein
MEIIVKTSSRQGEFSPNMALSTFAEKPLFGENSQCEFRLRFGLFSAPSIQVVDYLNLFRLHLSTD